VKPSQGEAAGHRANMELIKTLKFFIVIFLAMALTSWGEQGGKQDLSRYAGRDLRKLGTNELASFQGEVKARTGVTLGVKVGWDSLESWLLAPYETSKTAWVMVEAYPGYDVPDVSSVQLHFFDKSWAHICSESFPTGYRMRLDEVKVEKRKELGNPVIMAKTISTGPFITSPGPKRPAFEQGDFQRQYYALLQTNLFLVRMEDNEGVLVRNHYRWRIPPKGPPVPARTKEEWIGGLNSSNVVEQLSTLVWLTGSHLSSKWERRPDHNEESVEDSKLFESVSTDPRTAAALERLKKDKNKWVQDYATLGVVPGPEFKR
jgi:hypothetical protein